jgi:hypothetical protein
VDFLHQPVLALADLSPRKPSAPAPGLKPEEAEPWAVLHQLVDAAVSPLSWYFKQGRTVLSINDHPEIRRVFDGFTAIPLQIRYTVGREGRD